MTTAPTLKLYDATGGLQGPFLLADTDGGYPADRLYFLYITVGPAQDLPARVDIGDAEYLVPAANWWDIREIDRVLEPIPQGARVTVNNEHRDGKYGWTLDQFACSMARLKAARPDIRWSMYAAHAERSPKEYAVVKPYLSFITSSVYPGVYANANLDRVEVLMKNHPDAIVLVGWVHQTYPGIPRPTPKEEYVRDVMYRLFKVGVTHLGTWMGPPKPGVVRYSGMILPMGQWAVEEFARVHGPSSDVDPDAGVDAVTDHKLGDVCEHGSLARQCLVCQLEAEVRTLEDEAEIRLEIIRSREAEVTAATARADKAEALCSQYETFGCNPLTDPGAAPAGSEADDES